MTTTTEIEKPFVYPDTFLTMKQVQLLTVIVKKNEDGSPVDLDEILERLSYETSKESLQFSLRALVKKGLINKLPMSIKRRGRMRRCVEPTPDGTILMAGGTPTPKSIIETPEQTATWEELRKLEEDFPKL
jgi:DNA-binding MarR family transcriptional regulator